MKRKPRNLLFTGGWDSSFRLLHLLLVEKQPVQPIYVLDPDRRSYSQELKTMTKIKREVIHKYPESRELLLPTLMFDMTDLEEDPEIKAAEKAALKQSFFGSQYEWLARTVKQHNFEDAEMCLEHHTGPVGAVPLITPLVEEGEDGLLRFPKKLQDTAAYGVFGPFSYPVLKLTKPDMMEIARQHGFLDNLEMSWFCHRPNILNQPCGFCNPCTDAMTKGMPHRVPPLGKLCHHLKRLLDPRPFLKKYPSVYNRLKTFKEGILS